MIISLKIPGLPGSRSPAFSKIKPGPAYAWSVNEENGNLYLIFLVENKNLENLKAGKSSRIIFPVRVTTEIERASFMFFGPLFDFAGHKLPEETATFSLKFSAECEGFRKICN